jgi:hypothetical protein
LHLLIYQQERFVSLRCIAQDFNWSLAVHPYDPGNPMDDSVRKTAFLSHLYIKTNILPRQARDKHRENSKKMPFFAGVR